MSTSNRTPMPWPRAIAIAALVTAVVALILFGVPAIAKAEAPDCKTVAVNLVDRPDNGHGTPTTWALNTMKRTITVCHGPQPEATPTDGDALKTNTYQWKYTATLKDTGTFVTKGSETGSPNDGKPLTAGAKGTVNGQATFAEFSSDSKWGDWQGPKYDGKTYEGTEPGTTGDWVKMLFKGGHAKTSITSYIWTYKTCVETWVDSSAKDNNDGQSDTAGDITGKACPSPSPSISVSASPAPSLPVTGDNTPKFVGLAAVLGLVGAGLIWAARKRRRVAFVAE